MVPPIPISLQAEEYSGNTGPSPQVWFYKLNYSVCISLGLCSLLVKQDSLPVFLLNMQIISWHGNISSSDWVSFTVILNTVIICKGRRNLICLIPQLPLNQLLPLCLIWNHMQLCWACLAILGLYIDYLFLNFLNWDPISFKVEMDNPKPRAACSCSSPRFKGPRAFSSTSSYKCLCCTAQFPI